MPEETLKKYTEDANSFVEGLVAEGYSKGDIFTKYVAGGKQVVYPVIGKDGKPHLEKKTFRTEKS